MAHTLIKHEHNIKNNQIFNVVYQHDLQMYFVPPSGYIKLEELQQWCVDRIKVLKLVEQISMQNYKKSPTYCLDVLIKELIKKDLHNFVKLINTSKYKLQEETKRLLRRNDCISHFILRSAFCFERTKRQWFFKQEVNFFVWRFSTLNEESIKTFISINKLQFPYISEEEKKNIQECLETSCINQTVEGMKFYKVHFTKIMNLVKTRQVFLKKGIAYVPQTNILSLILSEFKEILNEGFKYSREMISNIYDDERITKILTTLPKYINTARFKYTRGRQVFISELDELSETSYPLCMRVLHEALKANHHLTNGGRVQYCLFLKGIGLSLNDALKFWKDEFTKKIDETTFRKEYQYYIRYLYAKEGKQSDYTPFHCIKIFNSTVGPQDYHGCPFKCMTSDVLKKTLLRCGLVHSDVESVLQFSQKESYFEACKTYYEIVHNCIIRNSFDHPNIYFNHSREKFENSGNISHDRFVLSE